MRNLCVIPCRSGSVRIPGKNTRPFKGVPMVQRAVQTAVDANVFDMVVVYTDSLDTVKLVDGKANFVMREVDDGTKGTLEVTRECAFGIRLLEDAFDHVCCLYPCTPLFNASLMYTMWHQHVCSKRGHTVAVGAAPLRDAGACYWHTWKALMSSAPLIGEETGLYVLPEERVCDINTPQDWARAEQLYEEIT